MSTTDLLVGVVIVGAIGIFTYSKVYLGQIWEERDSMNFTVLFDDAKGLRGGEEVRMAGFKIGTITYCFLWTFGLYFK